MEDDDIEWKGGGSNSNLDIIENPRTVPPATLQTISKRNLAVDKKEEKDTLKDKHVNSNDKYIDASRLPNPTKRLLNTQIEYFPKIIKELKTHRRKTSHWAWYVWPTTMPGRSDRRSTAITDNSAEDLLKLTDIEAWSKILNLLSEYIEVNMEEQKGKHLKCGGKDDSKRKRTNTISYVIPSIDHGRIKYFLQYWLTHVIEITKEFPQFYSAVLNFKQSFSKKYQM